MGQPAARLTDMHVCPMVTGVVPHVGGPIVGPGCPTVLIQGMPAARISDMAVCAGPPDVIVKGSIGVLIGGLPAARIGDTCAHGGAIITGCFTVLIGDSGAGALGGLGGLELPAVRLAMAQAMVQVGGSGDAADAALVSAQLAKMPGYMLLTMTQHGTRVIACRGSVTDYRSDLRGVHPRGWPPGATWDTVPGANMGDTNEVVIATTGHGTPAGAHVPATGEGHGSANLVVHEASHGYDHDTGASGSADFNAARTADSGSLSAYESQPGSAGQEESFAESNARHAEGQDAGTPNLQSYWNTH